MRLLSLRTLGSFVALALVEASTPAGASDPGRPAPSLDEAVASVRHAAAAQSGGQPLDEAKLTELDRAWEALGDAGAAGAARLRRELQALDAGGEPDDFFRLGACAVLWRLHGTDEAAAIARQWRKVRSFGPGYTYVFPVAMEAARTRDPGVVPMLVELLRDDRAVYIVPTHSMEFGWPNTAEMAWGLFGPSGLPSLRDVLGTSPDSVARAGAAYLLGLFADPAALPALRAALTAPNQPPRVREKAALALGRLGHPADFDLLAQLLHDADPRMVHAAASALDEYGDLRAVPPLVARLQSLPPAREGSPVAVLRAEIVSVLFHLTTEAGWQVLVRYEPRSKREREVFDRESVHLKETAGVTWDEYRRLSPAEQARIRAQTIAARDRREQLQPGDRTLTRADFKAACGDWSGRQRITGGPYSWVAYRQLVACVDPADLDLLREVRGAVGRRLSDDMGPELETLDRMVALIARKSYRANIGVCEVVTAPAGPRPPP